MSGGDVAYSLDDPREVARAAPYTFFLPPQDRLEAIGPDDLVQLVFRPTAAGTKWDAERMWVRVTAVDVDGLSGRLESTPEDIPGLLAGAEIRFQLWQAINVSFADQAKDAQYPASAGREYWDMCLVDQAVLDGSIAVEFIYREVPEPPSPDHTFPDSGWRIRGDSRNSTDEELNARGASYVALGAVLNRDDSWIHLIDEPVGSAFMRDFETGEYLPTSESAYEVD